MLSENLEALPLNRAIVLSNRTCAYCGVDFEGNASTKEHVVGRRFVPKGTLAGEWNLILRACERCNNQKSLLENDISAITIFGNAWVDRFSRDSVMTREALRKAKSKSELTGRQVGQSMPCIRMNAPIGSTAMLKLALEAPPQIDDKRLHELACMHMRALFYFVTYRDSERRGAFWRGPFIAVAEARRANWGNVRLRAFADLVADWEPRFYGFTAKEHFGAVIRRHPTAACWSWALEWNQHYRLVGFFGDEETGVSLARALPYPKFDMRGGDEQVKYAISIDVPLANEHDRLFEWLPLQSQHDTEMTSSKS